MCIQYCIVRISADITKSPLSYSIHHILDSYHITLTYIYHLLLLFICCCFFFSIPMLQTAYGPSFIIFFPFDFGIKTRTKLLVFGFLFCFLSFFFSFFGFAVAFISLLANIERVYLEWVFHRFSLFSINLAWLALVRRKYSVNGTYISKIISKVMLQKLPR